MSVGIVFLVCGILAACCAWSLRGLWGCVFGSLLAVVCLAAGAYQVIST